LDVGNQPAFQDFCRGPVAAHSDLQQRDRS
jgi:hypothetical protein